MLMEVLFWFPTVRTVTCCGGALGAKKKRHNVPGSAMKDTILQLEYSVITSLEVKVLKVFHKSL